MATSGLVDPLPPLTNEFKDAPNDEPTVTTHDSGVSQAVPLSPRTNHHQPLPANYYVQVVREDLKMNSFWPAVTAIVSVDGLASEGTLGRRALDAYIRETSTAADDDPMCVLHFGDWDTTDQSVGDIADAYRTWVFEHASEFGHPSHEEWEESGEVSFEGDHTSFEADVWRAVVEDNEGLLVDEISEEIDGFGDAAIRALEPYEKEAAVRDVHKEGGGDAEEDDDIRQPSSKRQALSKQIEDVVHRATRPARNWLSSTEWKSTVMNSSVLRRARCDMADNGGDLVFLIVVV
jgi:hypothetical protein